MLDARTFSHLRRNDYTQKRRTQIFSCDTPIDPRSRAAVQKPSAPTIADVAAAAGVSLATASRALAGYGRVAAATIDRVRDAADGLGYRPNELARSMRIGSTTTIGLVVIADFTNAFFDRVTKSIVDTARANGYQVIISNTDEEISVEFAAVQTMLDKQVDGILVVPSLHENSDHLLADQVNGKPVVLLDRYTNDARLSSVTTDDRLGTRRAVDESIALGHRRLGFLISTVGVDGFTDRQPEAMISTVRERVEGFRAGAIVAGDRVLSEQWRFAQDSAEAAEGAIASMLDEPHPPTVVFCSNNDMLIASLRVIAQRGMRVGHDISIVTVDDSPWASAFSPGIAVVARPVEEVGEYAVRLLLERIADPGHEPVTITLPTEFIARGSLAPPPAS
ncbi:MAG: hypothetical protein C0444_06230 [Microbacterium sp.]|nr:hypothetical protein [Microbacterium sp.]MBA4345908.1 hypothetical protein [Microbacterium sp.]